MFKSSDFIFFETHIQRLYFPSCSADFYLLFNGTVPQKFDGIFKKLLPGVMETYSSYCLPFANAVFSVPVIHMTLTLEQGTKKSARGKGF